jgi:hypothetical protein
MAYADVDIPKLKSILLALIPKDGASKGNMSLRDEFVAAAQKEGVTLDHNDYWSLRELLIDDRLITTGRGKGGSVRLVAPTLPVPTHKESETTAPPVIEGATPVYAKESDLYQPFLNTICKFFVLDYRIKLFVAEVTAQQGSRATGGKWTRPDVTLVAVRMHDFIPGKSVVVNTFEIKPTWSITIDGVFEASSHSAFANRSFLAIHVPEDVSDAVIERIERECKRFGTGLILFNDPTNWDTFDIRVDAQTHSPDAEDVDEFIATQISHESKEKLRAWIR